LAPAAASVEAEAQARLLLDLAQISQRDAILISAVRRRRQGDWSECGPALEILRKVEKEVPGLSFRFTDAAAGANHY